MRRWILYIIGLLISLPTMADWESYLAYNKVNQIAVTEEKVYALSNGNLFSVQKTTEQIEKLGTSTGLHGSNVSCLYFDTLTHNLLITYSSGKIDVMNANGIHYVSGFYTKDITDEKTVKNITTHNGRAFLATPFGIVTFDLRKQELVDVYYIGNNASKVNLDDIVIEQDSIYAYSGKTVYKAHIQDNLVDYRVWESVPAATARPRDLNKGVKITDSNGDIWEAGGENGVLKHAITGEELAYKPNGPYENTPYRMTAWNGKLYVVPGGRWATQNRHAGRVMIFDGKNWDVINTSDIKTTNNNPVLDFMHVAIDPQDEQHFFVTSYGTGLFEFQNNQFLTQYLPNNSTLASAAEVYPLNYTRCDDAKYDAQGNLFIMNAGVTKYPIAVRTADGDWNGITLTVGGDALNLSTPLDLILDNQHPNKIWTGLCRINTGVVLLDHSGTLFDMSDDTVVFRNKFTDQNDNTLTPNYIYIMSQMSNGDIWLGTDIGVIILPHDVDFLTSAVCRRLNLLDESDFIFETEAINAIVEGLDKRIYVGTATRGVYVLSADGQSITDHYTMDNTPMPSNSILSLAVDNINDILYIGTSEGIAARYSMPMSITETYNTETDEDKEYGSMKQWRSHKSYASIDKVEVGKNVIYALADGSLMQIDKQDESITYIDKSSDLNGDRISHLLYDKHTQQLILIYSDGMIDFVSEDKKTVGIPDLYQSMISNPTTINSITLGDKYAYISLGFGILVLNPQKREMVDTYYIGSEGSNVNVLKVIETSDSLFAATADHLYAASRKDNMMDYTTWHTLDIPTGTLTDIAILDNTIYILVNNQLYRWKQGVWEPILTDMKLQWMVVADDKIMAYDTQAHLIIINTDLTVSTLRENYSVSDIDFDPTHNTYWLAASSGVIRINPSEQWLQGTGPQSNNVSYMQCMGENLYVCPGGKWAVRYFRAGDISILKNDVWENISVWETNAKLGIYPMDFTSVAIDKTDAGHFFVTSYGNGVFEYRDYLPYKQHTEGKTGCTLITEVEGDPTYVRTDGATFDNEGNLWVINAGTRPNTINIYTPQEQWFSYNINASLNGGSYQRTPINTPGPILIDALQPNHKWIFEMRSSTGLILLDDRGTPTISSDDRACKRNTFIDQDGKQVAPNYIYSLAQDLSGDIWVGTDAGLFIVQQQTDFFKSNLCYRVIIPRNDGTNLADYLLDNEQIQAIVVDGGNRKWIGTASSGLYLVSEDGKTTLEHFTTSNSLLPSNTILSLAINPISGEVFIGTANGIVSYQSDASEAQDDLENVYAYPNPVRPNYAGDITIKGLMEHTVVNIIDAAGNLVCKTNSNGGTAIWDGKDGSGRRVATGVYTVLCNTSDGANTATTKILFIH